MRIGFIGAGQMAQALAAGIVRGGFATSDEITISDPNPSAVTAFKAKVGNVHIADNNTQVAKGAPTYLVFAVKPQYFYEAIETFNLADVDTTVVSVMSGVRIEEIQNQLRTKRVIRVMPNTPCMINAGASGMACGVDVTTNESDQVKEIMKTMGECITVSENLLDTVTGLSGSGPAFVFTFIEALADGGVLGGLSRPQALKLAAQTVMGAAKLVLESGEHPAVLRDRVASPAGTTIEGIAALESGGLRAAVISAVECATLRSEELGQK